MSIESFPSSSASTGTVTSITQGTGILNTPNPITTSGTVALDINSLTSETQVAVGDLFPFLDVSVGTAPTAQRKATIDDVRSALELQFRRTAWTQQTDTISALSSTSMGATSGSGTQSATTDSTGAYLNYASVATTGSNAGWTGPTTHTQRQLLPDARWTIKTGAVGADITVCRVWIVLNDTGAPAPMNADDPAGANLMGFRFSTSAGDTNWQCAVKDGTTLNLTNSGIAVASNTRYEMRVDASSGTDVKFYINGAFIVSVATNMPTSTANLQMFALVRTLENVTKNIKMRRYHIRDL